MKFVIPGVVSILVLLGMLIAKAQHSHSTGDSAIHEFFYQTWMRPDNPSVSCCNLQDCYPTEARQLNGNWFAKRREDGRWLPVPPAKIETVRDNPDGRSHLCAQAPGRQDIVYCFSVGGGT